MTPKLLLPGAMLGALLGGWSMSLCALGGDAPADPSGTRQDVAFTEYAPLARSSDLLRRLLSPLTAMHAFAALARSGKVLREEPIDLAHEAFAVHVPPGAVPPQGYALLVFVPPWEEAELPPGWTAPLDRHGMIFVSAANSGNAAPDLDRRIPLALLAAHNIMRRYPVDPARAYVGGFSGGSRVALHIALDYPDLFRGVVLNAGSDPIGTGRNPLPSAELFRRFQDSSRLVYVTGGQDQANLKSDLDSRQSMQDWCVFGVDVQTNQWRGHEPVNAADLNRALDALANHPSHDAARLADCRARIDQQLAVQLQQAEGLLASGKLDEASTMLEQIDARYGGLAAPRSIELSQAADTRR